MDYDQVLYQVEDGVGLVTLNRPERLNAMTAQMGAEMGDVMAEADGDDDVRVVVVTGAGRGFCAGADLGSGENFGAGWGGVEQQYRRMMPMEVRKPVIAAINGPAVGAGLTWPLQADIRYVAEDAKLAFAFVRRGVLPELASHVILPRLAGLSKATELLLSGRTFLGTEAVEYGVATRAFPADPTGRSRRVLPFHQIGTQFVSNERQAIFIVGACCLYDEQTPGPRQEGVSA